MTSADCEDEVLMLRRRKSAISRFCQFRFELLP
jgi:hypothetical protein